MAGVYATNTVAATHGAAAVEGLLDISEQYSRVEKQKPGDGAPLQYDQVDNNLSLRLTFSSQAAAAAFAAAAEANLVIRQRLFGGTFQDVTYKNVQGNSSDLSVPTAQDTGIGRVTITARASFASDDTYATMKTSAAV